MKRRIKLEMVWFHYKDIRRGFMSRILYSELSLEAHIDIIKCGSLRK